eukprot:SAG22_NODE_820_length_7011_cov_2.073640_5_plen_92_part_00
MVVCSNTNTNTRMKMVDGAQCRTLRSIDESARAFEVSYSERCQDLVLVTLCSRGCADGVYETRDQSAATLGPHPPSLIFCEVTCMHGTAYH